MLRTVYTVLLGLLGPDQSPVSRALFGLQGYLQGKEELGFSELLLAPVGSAWVPVPPLFANTECSLSFLLQKSLNETFGADKYSEARKEVLTNMFSRPMQVRTACAVGHIWLQLPAVALSSTLAPSALP